ncbi:polyphosphate polymerase domain-containing protein [Aquimarina algiphila]|uniref:Polyphosphate polymerase domain-containing protein n=2 Tax=Flavobacteriaceae TaxID=49546 RepID=A0A554VFM6_9FLAO|nr:polyphosphate polymerase domain-containing protein [Aquimarina algiphila]
MVKNMEKAVSENFHKPLFHNLRYERKFIFQNIDLNDLIQTIVYTNNFCFEEIYSKRAVNNIYFDDNNYTFYKQNVSGDGIREKYRLRWYNSTPSIIKSPIIEIKKKIGEVGDKFSLKMPSFESNIESLSIDQINSQIIEALKETKNEELIFKLHSLFPTLSNSYERRYFLSSCEKFRITLDFNMIFFNPNNYNDYHLIDNEIILELKYNKEYDNESRAITQQINSRLSKNSKYVRGIEIIHS